MDQQGDRDLFYEATSTANLPDELDAEPRLFAGVYACARVGGGLWGKPPSLGPGWGLSPKPAPPSVSATLQPREQRDEAMPSAHCGLIRASIAAAFGVDANSVSGGVFSRVNLHGKARSSKCTDQPT